jgi:hypothetical protein
VLVRVDQLRQYGDDRIRVDSVEGDGTTYVRSARLSTPDGATPTFGEIDDQIRAAFPAGYLRDEQLVGEGKSLHLFAIELAIEPDAEVANATILAGGGEVVGRQTIALDLSSDDCR